MLAREPSAMTGLTIVLLLWALVVLVDAQRLGLGSRIEQTREHLDSLDKAHTLAGTLAIHHGGTFQFQGGYGFAVPELEVRMKPSYKLYIGSNTKFFTAVALWQLQAQGLIDLDAPVIKYMDKADFNKTEDWCPRLYGSNSTECMYPTTKQLLMMSSGLVAVDGCETGAYLAGAWQSKYCISNDQWSTLIDDSLQETMTGGHTPAEYFVASNTWDAPLESKPGTEFQYVNQNYGLAAYLIEKTSGLSYGSYLAKHIFKPAGLTGISYDLNNGNNGVQKGCVPHPGYRNIFSPVSKEYLDTVNATSSYDADVLMKIPAGQIAGYAKTYDMPGWQGFANGAGALCSTPKDLLQFWHTVLFQPGLLGLNTSTVREMLNTYSPGETYLGSFRFAQGMMVRLNSTFQPYGVDLIKYTGGVPGEVNSPFFLKFLDPNKGVLDKTFSMGAILTMTNEFQVPLNQADCTVQDWRKNNVTVAVSQLVCSAANRFLMYEPIFDKLTKIWANFGYFEVLL